jgi:hypothetical protein
MAGGKTLRRVDFARRGAEVLAVMVAEVPADDLTPEEAGDLREARNLLCGAGAALRSLMSRSTPHSTEKGPTGGWRVPVGYFAASPVALVGQVGHKPPSSEEKGVSAGP